MHTVTILRAILAAPAAFLVQAVHADAMHYDANALNRGYTYTITGSATDPKGGELIP